MAVSTSAEAKVNFAAIFIIELHLIRQDGFLAVGILMVCHSFSLHPQDGHRSDSTLLCVVVIFALTGTTDDIAEAKLEEPKPTANPGTVQQLEDAFARLQAGGVSAGKRDSAA
jgi:hypothetical protein